MNENAPYAPARVAGTGDVRVLLIGGTSHVGKSTLAQALASQLGWRHHSTDRMARHPGRPWGHVPDHVRTHYRTLSVEELTAAQVEHYERLWPAVEQLVSTTDRLVLEGSGILPARVAARAFPRVAAYWLVADAAMLRTRVNAVSGFEQRTADEQLMIEKFLGRTARFNDVVVADAGRWGRHCIDVGGGQSVDDLTKLILADAGLHDGPEPYRHS